MVRNRLDLFLSVVLVAAVLIVAVSIILRSPETTPVDYRVIVVGANGTMLHNALIQVKAGGRVLVEGLTDRGVFSFKGAPPSDATFSVDASGYTFYERRISVGDNRAVLVCGSIEFVAPALNQSGTSNAEGLACEVGDAHTRFRLSQLVTEFVVRTPSNNASSGFLDCGNGQSYELGEFAIENDAFLTACGYVYPGNYSVSLQVNGAQCNATVRVDFPCGTQ
ncbi:hypothetical protein AUJ14_00740 [Candidatus Micrarchaeota archaeon CG1_02_55_22]|nr:MAG: hypothetical protein AUJ14_00740 [Candidatus Micrarchaeota archaeon CG1_02_55_22]